MSSDHPAALLTGASSGIGAATAARLADLGMRLLLVGRNVDALGQVAERLPHSPEVFVADLEHPGDVVACSERILKRFDTMAAIVNCAGVMLNRRIENTSLDDINRLMTVNVSAPLLLCQRLLPALRQAHGAIVNVVSVSAMQGVASQGIYSASKSALIALTRSMATEWGEHGIRANAVAPGVVLTPMSERYAVPPYSEYIDTNIPLGRWGVPDDLAATIAFLCSDDARYITGQVITVDGGLGSLYWLSRQGKA